MSGWLDMLTAIHVCLAVAVIVLLRWLMDKWHARSKQRQRQSDPGSFLTNGLRHRILHTCTGDNVSLWANLGLWAAPETESMKMAAERMASILADSLSAENFGPAATVLDVAYGCGDSLALWHRKYKIPVQNIHGVTGSPVQHRAALSRFQFLRMDKSTVGASENGNLKVGHVRDFLANVEAATANPEFIFDSVLCIDAAYHFAPDRLEALFLPLRKRCREVGLVDLTVADRAPGWVRWLLSKLAAIPVANMWSADKYREMLVSNGYEIRNFESIGRFVFPGFREFVRARRSFSLLSNPENILWLPISFASWSMHILFRMRWIDMHVIVCRPKRLMREQVAL